MPKNSFSSIEFNISQIFKILYDYINSSTECKYIYSIILTLMLIFNIIKRFIKTCTFICEYIKDNYFFIIGDILIINDKRDHYNF